LRMPQLRMQCSWAALHPPDNSILKSLKKRVLE
jgi:hypothetical protein